MNISAYQTKPLVHSFKKISTNKKLRMKKMKKKKRQMFCEKHCNLLVYIDVIIIPYLIVQCSQKQIVKRISIVTTLNQRQDIKQSMPGIIQLSFEF